MSLTILLITVFSISGLLMLSLHFLYASALTDEQKIYPARAKKNQRHTARNVAINTLMSTLLIVGISYGLSDYLFNEAEFSVLSFTWESLATLALYDFLYYFMHRFLFHEWDTLRSVHIVHHTNKFPTVFESLYAHPVEIAMGVLLLMGCVAVVGPISLSAFALVLAVFSFFNLFIHSGLNFKRAWLRPIAYINRKHARHHASMKAGNYASISPLPDILFGTAED